MPAPSPLVLVVEDDAGLRLALEHGLAAEGFRVAVAPDAATAYRVATREDPDVVLLDWGLPGDDGGLEACRRLREAGTGTPVVMLTGRSDRRDRRDALAAGASRFLSKGIALEALAGELRALLAGADDGAP